MKAPIFNSLSLLIPACVAVGGYIMARSSKGATNMGEALGPYFAWAILVVIAAAIGEVSAIIALFRGERMTWLSWLGAILNALILFPVILLLLNADWN